MVGLNWYMWLSLTVFSIGMVGFLTRRNIIIVFMSIELMLNAVNINLVAISHFMQDARGQVLTFFIIAVAAAEAAIGLAILIAIFRTKGVAHVDEATEMKG
ncbi:MAG: NADH-quinone oxidoreductase subunit NuoK [Dissulfurispiraceae bacterium]